MVTEEIRINLKKKNILFFVFVVLFIVLVFPTLARFYDRNDSLIGSEPYYHFRAARELMKSGSLNLFSPPEGVVDVSYSPREYFFNPYHYLLVYASGFVSLATASRIVPFLLGILSVLLFNLILMRFMDERYKRHMVLLLLVINPAFIYTFTVSNSHCAAIALSLLGFYIFLQRGLLSTVVSAACFVLVSMFSLFNALLVVSLLLAYVLVKKEFQNRFVVVTFLLVIFSLAKRASFFYNYTFTPDASLFSNLISDLGGIIGFGIFSIVLAVYGVSSNWKGKSDFLPFFLLAVLLFLSVLFVGNVANMYLVFLVAVAAGVGFVKLYELQWSAVVLKNLAILILVCGLLFSAASYLTRLSSMSPDRGMVDSLDWLGSNTFKDRFVLSYHDNGYFISTISRNPVLADSLSTSEYDQKFFYKVQDSMFYTRKLDTAKQLFDVYNVKYVYVTPEMRSGQVWRKPNEGLLFLFTNEDTFRKVYDKDGFEVWEVLNTTVS